MDIVHCLSNCEVAFDLLRDSIESVLYRSWNHICMVGISFSLSRAGRKSENGNDNDYWATMKSLPTYPASTPNRRCSSRLVEEADDVLYPKCVCHLLQYNLIVPIMEYTAPQRYQLRRPDFV